MLSMLNANWKKKNSSFLNAQTSERIKAIIPIPRSTLTILPSGTLRCLYFDPFLFWDFNSSIGSPEFKDPSFAQRIIDRSGELVKMIGEFITSILVLVLGYAYPAFQCFKTVEKNRVEIPELRFWCQYWIIVAVITILEKIGDVFISWLPMYGEMKLALFIYLWYPKTKGTGYVYETLVRPYVSKHETGIDRSLLEFRERAWNLAIYYWHNCTELGSTKILQFLQFVASQSGRITGSEEVRQAAADYAAIGTSTSYRNQTPQSESIKVELQNQTQFIRPEDILIPDSDIGGRLDEKSGVDHEIQAARLRLRRFIDSN
ncbi:hypothetical protein Pfo_028579 [Paulownia fortunei]|nr:hypothetical protein Pfo_028579 [Paulownia fortunei]